MTSAADLLPTQPAARPEPAVRGRAAENDAPDSAFADLLDAEAPAADLTDDTMNTEAVVVPAPVQPAPQQPVPTANSAAAILAGLTTEGGEKIDAAGAETLPVLPEFTGAEGVVLPEVTDAAATTEAAPAPAVAPQIAATPVMAPAPVEAALTNSAPVAAVAVAPAAAVATQPAAEADDSGEETAEASADPAANADEAAAKPVVTTPETSPIITTAAAVRPTVAPATIVTPDAPTSAPGAERMAAEAPDASAPRQLNGTTPAAAAHEAPRTQGGINRPTHANASAAEVAANISADAAPSSTPSVATDITAPRVQAGAETTRTAAAHPALQNAPAATIQVYQRMIDRVDGRAQRFEVRLDPAELGRVDVRIEVGADKKVHAVLAAHDSAALNDLMRGQRALERALTEAGIDLADGGVRFELSSDTGRGSANNQSRGDGNAAPSDVWRRFSTIDVAADQQTVSAVRGWRPSRLDLVA